MDKVVLNYEQVLNFTQLKQKYIEKNGQKVITRKLTNMGMLNIYVTGRGKNVIYEFEIPKSFWSLLQVPTIRYKEDAGYLDVLTALISMIIEGTVRSDGIVQFHSVSIAKIAAEYGKEYKTVEYHANSFKSHLNKCGLLKTGRKSHRIKFNDMETWATGKIALERDEKIKNMWKEFFDKHFKFYKTTKFYKGYEQSVPKYLIKRYIDEFRYFIIDFFQLDAYKVAKEVTATEELLADIEWSRETFLRTFDMDMVRLEIKNKHEDYKQKITALVPPKTVKDTNIEPGAIKKYKELYEERNPIREKVQSPIISCVKEETHPPFLSSELFHDNNVPLEDLL